MYPAERAGRQVKVGHINTLTSHLSEAVNDEDFPSEKTLGISTPTPTPPRIIWRIRSCKEGCFLTWIMQARVDLGVLNYLDSCPDSLLWLWRPGLWGNKPFIPWDTHFLPRGWKRSERPGNFYIWIEGRAYKGIYPRERGKSDTAHCLVQNHLCPSLQHTAVRWAGHTHSSRGLWLQMSSLQLFLFKWEKEASHPPGFI